MIGLIYSDLARTLGNPVYDTIQGWFPAKPDKDIVIVAIDDKSLDALGGWPLSRKHYADLLGQWDDPRCKPLAIGIDLLFLDATPQDAELAEKMAAHKVVLPLEFRWDPRTSDAVDFKTAVIPIRSAASFGHINIAFDADGVVRRLNLKERQWPHFSAQLKALSERDGSANEPAPIADNMQTESAPRGIRPPPAGKGYQTVSLSDALMAGCSTADFKDKLVLIGVTAPSLGDRFPTASSVRAGSSAPGVEILASALDAIRSGTLIRDLSTPGLAVCSIAALGLYLLLFLVMPLSYLLLTGLLLQSLWVALCTYLLHSHFLWLNPVPACLAMTAAALLWALVRHESIVLFMQGKTRDLQKSAHTAPLPAAKATVSHSIVSSFQEMSSAVSSVQQELEFLSLVVNEMPEAVAVYNEKDELLLTNRHIQSLFDAATLALNAKLSALLEQLQIDVQTLLAFTERERKADEAIHVFGVRTELGERDFSLKSSVIRGPEGNLLRLLFLADVTELRKHQIQRDRTLRFLSHDMRTPIAAIISLIRLNSSRARVDDGLNRGPQMLQQAHTLLQMVDDFTFTVSAEVGNFKFKDELLETLLNDALEQVMPLAQAKGQTVEDINPVETVFVTVDTRLFIRALVNLLANAVKFAPPDSRIVLETKVLPASDESSKSTPKVHIAILNQVQAQASKAKIDDAMEGFGIGLNFVENVLRKHYGTIHRSIPTSGNATVSIRLPCTIQN